MANISPQGARVLSWIDDHREEVIGFLQDLIRIPSVNPWFTTDGEICREGEVQALVAEKMKALGAEIDLWEPDPADLARYEGHPGYYADHRFEGRPNLAAVVRGNGGGRSLLLAGHIDVVLPGEGWTRDPFGAERAEGRIYGRGAVDMKGGVAAMIMALEAVLRSGLRPKGDVTVGTLVDEEAGGMGTLAFVDRGYRADGCFMTEPSGLMVSPLCRGILWGKLTVRGRSGHIEMPQGDWRDGGAVDAIDKARLFLDQIDRLNRDWKDRKTHPLQPTPCQVYVSQIAAGEYPTSFANRAEIHFNAQYLPSEADEKGRGTAVQAEIETFFRRVAETDPWLRDNPPEVEWLIDADCGEIPGDHPFVTLCAESLRALGVDPVVQGSSCHTDMGWFIRRGTPTVNFGPGDPRIAHHTDEFVEEEELLTATKAMALALVGWCGVDEA